MRVMASSEHGPIGFALHFSTDGTSLWLVEEVQLKCLIFRLRMLAEFALLLQSKLLASA